MFTVRGVSPRYRLAPWSSVASSVLARVRVFLASCSVSRNCFVVDTTRLVVTAVRPKADESEKSARRPKADGHSVHGRRPLHGQCHGFQRPWPSSGMLSASADVARARRWSNHLAPSVSSGGAKQLAFLVARSPLAVGMPTQILMTLGAQRHMWSVRRS